MLLARAGAVRKRPVSVLFNEPKLLKCPSQLPPPPGERGFSALQRAEIAEIQRHRRLRRAGSDGFSALQRAEIAEIYSHLPLAERGGRFQCSSTSRNC